MIFDIRLLNDTDYEDILVGWWKDWRWTAPSKDFLPSVGLIVYDEDIPVCAGYIYTTNSAVAWVDWIISNFNYKDKENRKQALKLLVDTLTNVNRDSGFKYCYALIKNKSLINTYKELGYTQADSYTSEMIKKL
jgi:hypothetical protein